MYEHSTKPGHAKKKTKIHTATKATDPQRMGTVRKRCPSRRKTSHPSNHAVSMEKGLKSGCTDLSQRQTPKSRSTVQRIRARKHKTQRGSGDTNPGTDVVKKKDELGLANRRKGSFYSKTQRARIVDEIERLFARGITKTEALKTLVVDALDDLKAVNPVILDVTGLTDIMDYMIIASGTSNRHVKSLADHVCMEAKKQGVRAIGVEGEGAGDWVLVDFGDLVVHVMLPAARDFYDLERLWVNPDTTS